MTFKLTELGKLLEAQLAAGSKPIITRIEGSDAYSSNPEALLAVQNVKQSLQVESVTVVDGKSHLKFILSNIGLDEEYYLKQIGIYAKQTEDSEEILYFIGQDRNGERIPAISEKEVEFEYDLTITVDNAYEVTVAVNGNDFARKEALDELDKKKIDGAGGDISNTVIAATEESKTEYPVPAAGDSAKTVLGKIQKFFADIRNWMTGVCMLGQIVNNCVTDNAKLPLSAAQGKALMDLYNVLNTNQKKIFPQVSFNTPNTDFLALIADYDCAFGNVFQQSAGGSIKNWISNTHDGAFIKIGRFVIACDGWSTTPALYVCRNWGKWSSWELL